MAEVTPKSGVLIMANGDTYTPNGKKIIIKGVRLIAGSANATATITSSESKVIYSLAAVIGTADESVIETNIDSTSLTAALAGTGASLYVYLG
jgi:hypothetical protein